MIGYSLNLRTRTVNLCGSENKVMWLTLTLTFTWLLYLLISIGSQNITYSN